MGILFGRCLLGSPFAKESVSIASVLPLPTFRGECPGQVRIAPRFIACHYRHLPGRNLVPEGHLKIAQRFRGCRFSPGRGVMMNVRQPAHAGETFGCICPITGPQPARVSSETSFRP